jgi:hypothetical protein
MKVSAPSAVSAADGPFTVPSSPAAALTGPGLIDEYRIVVRPVALGGGRQLFLLPEDRLDLRLVESQAFPLRYRRAEQDR